MPQIEQIATFPSQIFWLVVCFVVLYLLMWKVALPRIGDILAERQDRIDDDLQKAERLRNEAAEVLATYERGMAEGREKAQALVREAADRLAKESAARHAALTETLKRRTEEAERQIETARREALASVRTVAAETAQAAAAKLIGVEVGRTDAERAVDQAMGEYR